MIMSRLKLPYQVEDGVVIIECVAIFYEEGEGGEH